MGSIRESRPPDRLLCQLLFGWRENLFIAAQAQKRDPHGGGDGGFHHEIAADRSRNAEGPCEEGDDDGADEVAAVPDLRANILPSGCAERLERGGGNSHGQNRPAKHAGDDGQRNIFIAEQKRQEWRDDENDERAAGRDEKRGLQHVIGALYGLADALEGGGSRAGIDQPVEGLDGEIGTVENAPGDGIAAQHLGAGNGAENENIGIAAHGLEQELGGKQDADADFLAHDAEHRAARVSLLP